MLHLAVLRSPHLLNLRALCLPCDDGHLLRPDTLRQYHARFGPAPLDGR